MSPKGLKSVYNCSECGYSSTKWLGKCPQCGSWNSFVEDVIDTGSKAASAHAVSLFGENNQAKPFDHLELPDYFRYPTGLDELDRVLGGGLVQGSVVLLAGEPGIGKSTLLMQISDSLGKTNSVLYVSGEESGGQLKLRAKRLKIQGAHLFVLTETNMDLILSEIDRVHPQVLIIDSIQTMYHPNISSTPGSVTQVKESALSLIGKAKSSGMSVLIVGHVNKEGGIAGPKVLEHLVDAVVYFEGERLQAYRIIRANKNRFGSTNEIGVFEMCETGLKEIPNPSEMLLADRPKNTSGNCAVCTVEGTRPLIAEIQALVTPTSFPAPRRTSNGIDYNRMCLIMAVLEKKLGLRFSSHDVYLNVISGLRINEPASDLAVAMALMSSITNKVVPDDMLVLGEIGLSGECRAISNIETRIRETERLGFSRIVLPVRNFRALTKEDFSIQLLPVHSIYECIKFLSSSEEDT